MAHSPTPGLPEFDYIKPATLIEASRFLADHPTEARPFTGGTDMFVRLRDGLWKERYVVDVKHLSEKDSILFDVQTGLTIGAAATMNQIIASPIINQHYPLLAEAARTVASYQLRNRATITGNLCNGSPAGDTTGPCLVLNGELQVHGVDGLRTEPLRTFFLGPGKTVLKPGDIVTAIFFPPPPPDHAARYIKLGRNKIGDLAIVGVTALGYPDGTAASGYRFRLALASVAPVPLIPALAEAILAKKPITPETIAEAAKAAMETCSPISDTRGSARYRKLMVRNLVTKAVTEVFEKIRNQ